MATRDDEPQVHLATRIPKDLHHRLKLYCLEIDTSQMDFVSRALRERLDRLGTRTRGTRRREKPPAAYSASRYSSADGS